jgi:dihydroorotase
MSVVPARRVGEIVDLEISAAWAVDPAAGREGPADVVVHDGIVESVSWLDADDAPADSFGVVVTPGFVDLHAHFREPGFEDAETIASGAAAAAHGGFTTVCVMPNTSPATDDPGVVNRVRAAADASGSPVRVLPYGAVTAGRDGAHLAPIGELADCGVVGFSDDGAPVRSAAVLRNALAYAGMARLPVVDHPEDPTLTEGAEAHDGLIATVLGLRGSPAAAEEAAVGRDLAILADVARDVPTARLHLTHVSTAGALELVRRAKAAHLPVTCDVTPHHLALTDEWLAGARRFAWESTGDPWHGDAIVAQPYDPSLRVNPPLRTAADARACAEALIDGTADAIATDHAPHTVVDKQVEFGLAANGISGIETALGLVLAAVDAGRLPLGRAIAALTTGPRALLNGHGLLDGRGLLNGRGTPSGHATSSVHGGRPIGLVEGQPADLVVFDRSATWRVTADSLASKGKNSPLIGRDLPGMVLLTVAGGRVAYAATELAEA